MTSRPVSPFIYAGVFLISGVALGLEILLTRIMALMMWHHLTYVVIGVALLGFGAAGSYVTVREARAMERDPLVAKRLARYSLLLSISMPLCYAALTRVRIEPLKLGTDAPAEFVALFLVYVLIAVPFFFAGLVICDAIQSYSKNVGSIYFADLLGAGLGAVAAILLIEPLTGPGAVFAFSGAAALGATTFAAGRTTFAPGVVIQGGIGAVLFWFLCFVAVPYSQDGAFDPPLAPSKEIEKNKAVIGEVETHWNPLARIEIQKVAKELPAITGGTFPKDSPWPMMRYIGQDGTAPTGIVGWDGDLESLSFMSESSTALGHVALKARGVEGVDELVIGVGGGVDLHVGLQHGVGSITGIEINSTILRLLEKDYAEFSGGLAARPEVELVQSEGRSFARAAGRQFDLIQLSGVDTFTALSSGAYTLSEAYVYTREAIEDFHAALSDQGILSYSRFLFRDGPRETLRLAATAVEALEELGVETPREHIFLLGTAQWASLLVSKPRFEPRALEAMRAFAADSGGQFTVLYDPEHPQDNAFDALIRKSVSERESFYADYPFNVRPSTDDSPFFFNFFKWSGLWETKYEEDHPYFTPYPIGHLCLLVSLAQTLVLGALFILLPLRRLKGVSFGGGTGAALLYFTALGIGFIAVEIVLIQRFVLYLGHPTYSLTTVLPTMLISAGLGSLTVRESTDCSRRVKLLALWIPAVILVGWLSSGFLLDPLLGLPLGVRIAGAIALLFPIGFVLGMAFPAGVSLVSRRRPELVPWVWAVNSFTTVFGSTATVLVAMEVGFSSVMLAAIPLYLIGILALAWRFGGEPEYV